MADFTMKYEEGRDKYTAAIDDAEEDMARMGLALQARPVDERGRLDDLPSLPADMAQQSPEELQTLLGKFTSWYSYAIGEKAKAESRRNAAEKEKGFSWSRVRKTKSGTVADKDDATRVDSRFIDADANYEYCDAKAKALGCLVEGLKRECDTISRIATINEQRMYNRTTSPGQKKHNDSMSHFTRKRGSRRGR